MATTDRYVAMEKFYAKASAAQASANAVAFTVPYLPTGAIAQIRADANGAMNVTGLAVTIAQDGTTKVVTVTVAATNISANDHVSLIVFK